MGEDARAAWRKACWPAKAVLVASQLHTRRVDGGEAVQGGVSGGARVRRIWDATVASCGVAWRAGRAPARGGVGPERVGERQVAPQRRRRRKAAAGNRRRRPALFPSRQEVEDEMGVYLQNQKSSGT